MDLVFNNQYDFNYAHSHAKANRLEAFKLGGRVELATSVRLNFKETVPGIIQHLVDALGQGSTGAVVQPTTSSTMIILNEDLFLDVTLSNIQMPFNVDSRSASVGIYGRVEAMKAFYSKVECFIRNDSEVYVHWWFKAANEIKSIQFAMDGKSNFREEHYPYIPDADDYLQRFLDSPASVLILLGEPGTGKTSFIRHLLRKNKGECYITYDESVMNEDALFINFLSDKSVNFMILEDADLLLCERVRDNNKVMSKILNASDGLIPLNKKKVIFTANITDPSKIDEALRRPGRCFDVLQFRPLDLKEATGIAELHGRTLTYPTGKREFTLAEIFN